MSTAEISGVWPGFTFELAFGTTADTAAASFTDVSAYVREWGVNVGRQRRLDEFQAGTMWWVLDNRDRRFDPLYSAGPYFGNLLPMVQGRVRCPWNTVTYDMAYMYTDGWPQSYEPPAGMDSTVMLTFTDGFLILGRTPLKSVWQYTLDGLSPDRHYPLGESSGTVMGDKSGSGVHGVYEAGCTFNHRESVVPYASGGAIEFSGVDQVGRATPLDGNADFSFCVWAKMPNELPTGSIASTPVYAIVRNDAGDAKTHAQWRLYVYPDTGAGGAEAPAVVFAVQAVLGNPRWSDAPVSAGRVYFLAGSYESGATNALLFVNGVQQTDGDSNVGGGGDTLKNSLRLAAEASGVFDAFPGSLGEFAAWDGTELTPTNIAALYAAGAAPLDGEASGTRIGSVLDFVAWPASLRDLDTGTSLLGPAFLEGTALDYLQLVGATEAGLLYMSTTGKVTLVGRGNLKTEARFTTSNATFGDSTGEIPYSDIKTGGYDVVSIINGARVGRQGGVTQEYLDATSAGSYGPAYAPDETGLLMASDGEALDRATWKVLARKDPQFRVDSITINPRSAPSTAFPQVLGRILGDRITVKRRPGNPAVGSAISQDCYIEGISHRVTPLEWETTWALSAVDPNEASWAVVGSGAARNRVGTCKASY